jgi:hypothetical protein
LALNAGNHLRTFYRHRCIANLKPRDAPGRVEAGRDIYAPNYRPSDGKLLIWKELRRICETRKKTSVSAMGLSV